MRISPDEEKQYNAIFGTRVRFVVMVVVLLCLTCIWSNIMTLNFVLICMAPVENGTAAENADRYTYSSSEKTWQVSIVAIGALVTNIFVVGIINRVGIRTVFTVMGIISGVATILIPPAVRLGFIYLLACRFFQGVAFAANFPVIGAFAAKWAYFKQMGLLVSVLVAYVQLAPAITMSVSGPLCSGLGWPSVFYGHGAVALAIFIFYGAFYRNSPSKHPFVGAVEKGKIAIGKATVDKKIQQSVPWLAIFRTPAVWAVWAGAVANFTAVNLMLIFSPIYLSQVLHFSVNHTGFSAALPPFAQFVMKIVVGGISDKVRCISETNKLRLFNTLAMGGSAIFFIVLGFMGDSNKDLNMLALGAAAGALGIATGGFFKAGPLISKQYSHIVTGAFSIHICWTMLVVPIIVNPLTTGNTQAEWAWIFLGTAAVLLVLNLIFCIFVQAEPCEWTTDEWLKKHNSVADSSQEAPSSQRF